jgi:hypothetical protein
MLLAKALLLQRAETCFRIFKDRTGAHRSSKKQKRFLARRSKKKQKHFARLTFSDHCSLVKQDVAFCCAHAPAVVHHLFSS